MKKLRIALAQINVTVGALLANRRRIASAIAEAEAAGADLVICPELSICGYPPEDLLLKKGFLKDCEKTLLELARDVGPIAAMVGWPRRVGDKIYNAAAVLHQGAVVAHYHKIELPNYGVFDEKRYFHPGDAPLFIDLEDVRVSSTICEDVWIEGSRPERFALGAGADLVVNISGSPFYTGRLAARREVIAGFARRARTPVAYVNLVGGQDELVFDGGSMVVDAAGEVVAMARRFEKDLLIVDLELGPDRPARAPLSVSGWSVSLPRPHGPRPGFEPRPRRELSRVEEVYHALVLGLRDYVQKNGFSKVTLGLSGGVDSSLAACLAVEGLGATNVVGVTMPSRFTSAETRADAEALADRLGIKLLTVSIEKMFGAYLSELAAVLEYGRPGVEAENLQARIRGAILMALSNRFGWLVIATGNKSELSVGYATLYGDMAGGYALIKDADKTLVYELARHVNQKAGHELIPASVIERPPTAELRPDQKDEDSLPPYSKLDPILKAYIEDDRTCEELIAEGFDPELAREVAVMVDRNEYKRRQAPPGVKLTPKAFGRDRRLPLTNRYLYRRTP